MGHMVPCVLQFLGVHRSGAKIHVCQLVYCRVVIMFLCSPSLTVVSRKLIPSLFFSEVNLMVGWRLFK